MSEFNGKNYYGYSLQNDPTLLTTTRNFEFQYIRPEKLERAIQKVQLSDGPDHKHKKNLLAKYCKLKKPGGDLAAPYKTHDLDVETHISRTDQIRIRNLSEEEIDQLIGKARSNVNMMREGEKRDSLNCQQPNQQQQLQQQQQHEQEQQNPQQKQEQQQFESLKVPLGNEEDATNNNIIIEEYWPKPKWVEIEETSGYARLSLADLAHPQSEYPSQSLSLIQPQAEQQKEQEQQQHQQHRQHRQHDQHPQKNQAAPSQKDLGQRVQQMRVMSRTRAGDDTENAYFIEDSDYEYEMSKRLDYTKYCKKRPSLDEVTNDSNESGGIPRFIEIEHPHLPCMNLSFLKNCKPIRYTDLTDELVEDELVESSIKRGRDTVKGCTKVVQQSDKFIAELKSEKKPVKKEILDKRDAAKRKAHQVKLNINEPMTGIVKPLSSSPRKIIKPEIATSPSLSPKNRYKSKSPPSKTARIRNSVPIKSFEELKTEKVAIFNKMNVTQERIIEMLDKLRLDLLEVYVPESNYDRNRRQKNAMEFSVRFSRNFLYPLRGMVEDIQNTTVEQINSSSSNEACIRIASIYALMLQSLQTYQRQLRFFLLDQVPQKLTALISLVYATTNMCLEKDVFDMNDQVIECLLDRCSKFLGFLEDLHDERFMTVRENYRKSIKEKKTNLQNKYDLKMFMNDLNMYEPKLVPKRPSNVRLQRKGTPVCSASSTNTTARRRIKKTKKTTVEPIPVTSSEFLVTSATEDAVATQIQKGDCEASSDLLSSIYNLATSQGTVVEKDMAEPVASSLNKAIIEALQIVTKQQVRQVLEPILQSLGTALDKKDFLYSIERKFGTYKRMPVTSVPLRKVFSNIV